MITVSIIEDNEQFRQGLEAIIKNDADLFLAGSYSSAEKAIIDMPMNAPDIAIVDIGLPGMKGPELILRLRDKLLNTQFIVCSIHDDNDSIFESLQCGASGYILKEPITSQEITRAIHDLYNGGSPMSPYIARKVINSFIKKPEESIAVSVGMPSAQAVLSQREKEVLELLSRGLLYKEIAAELGVSRETIKKHLKNIYQKLHVQNKIEALNKFRIL